MTDELDEVGLALYRHRMEEASYKFIERARRRLGLRDGLLSDAICEELWRSFADGYCAGYEQAVSESLGPYVETPEELRSRTELPRRSS